MWIALTDAVKGAASKHYRKSQGWYVSSDVESDKMNALQAKSYDTLVERALLLAEDIKSTPIDKGIAYAITTFKRRFGQTDQKNYLEKRSRIGFSFQLDVDPNNADWDYGEYHGNIKPAKRPSVVDSHQEIQRLANSIYREYGNTLSPEDLFFLLTFSLKSPTKRSMVGLSAKLNRYFTAMQMERAFSLEEMGEYND
jgi:hypothetical protein